VLSVLDRYVAREAAVHATAGFLVVLSIFLVTRLSTLLTDASVGVLPGGVVAVLLGLRTLMALPSLLPAVLYLGVLLAIDRLSRDREVLAMESCGVGPRRIDRAILGLAVSTAAAIAVLSYVGRPWAAARFNAVHDDAVAATGLDDLSPGLFYELRSGSHEVVFADTRSPAAPHDLENVFVQRRTETGITVFSARHAVETRDAATGARFLVLEDGTQYELDPEGAHQTMTRFERMALRLPAAPTDAELKTEKTLSTRALAAAGDDPEAAAELQWRSAMPISAVLLALLAIPLGRTGPRQGRAAAIFLAALLYVGYRTLLGTAKSWVADGVLPPLPGLWLVHGACLATALVLARVRRTVAP
jgi:lipopolysaccharide export system permease protein